MKRLAILILIAAAGTAAPAGAFFLPDSDQRKCYQTVAPYAQVSCTGTGQDGATIINPLAYKSNGDGTVTDRNTGLMWQAEDDDIPNNWFQASGNFDPTHNLLLHDICGELDLGGYGDWRLPTSKELMSILDYNVSHTGPHIRSAVFPGTEVTAPYWASTPQVYYPEKAWQVSFGSGVVSFGDKSGSGFVRCVRRADAGSAPVLTDNLDGTVRDDRTGLVWQQGEVATRKWGRALGYCRDLVLGGHDDWRLPNAKELESLVDERRFDPATPDAFFPAVSVYPYWSSTTMGAEPQSAIGVEFYFGVAGGYAKSLSANMHVRCVRGGQSIRLVRPNGGEILKPGTRFTIRWEYAGIPGNVAIRLYRGSAMVAVIKSGLAVGVNGNGSYRWLVPADTLLADDYRVEVASETYPARKDISDAPFSIRP